MSARDRTRCSVSMSSHIPTASVGFPIRRPRRCTRSGEIATSCRLPHEHAQREHPTFGMCVKVGRGPAASMARVPATADLINTNQDRRVIDDRTRRVSLVMRMPGRRQSLTLVRHLQAAGNADTANDGGANAVVARRSRPDRASTAAGHTARPSRRLHVRDRTGYLPTRPPARVDRHRRAPKYLRFVASRLTPLSCRGALPAYLPAA
jgi:hypothetical protein